MPVLDTDILSIIQQRAEPEYTRLLAKLTKLPTDAVVWVTIVTFEEQLRGWLEYIKRAKPAQLPGGYAKLHELNADFSTRPVLPFSQSSVAVYERLVRAKTRVATMDLRIAAICIANDEVLVSRNLTDFNRVPNLRLEDWTR